MGTCWKCLIKIGVLSDLLVLKSFIVSFDVFKLHHSIISNCCFPLNHLALNIFNFLSASDLLSLAPLLLSYKEQSPLYLVIDFLRPFQQLISCYFSMMTPSSLLRIHGSVVEPSSFEFVSFFFIPFFLSPKLKLDLSLIVSAHMGYTFTSFLFMWHHLEGMPLIKGFQSLTLDLTRHEI